jgi:nucleoporin GLE1
LYCLKAQGEVQVSQHTNSAFPFAFVAVTLMQQFPYVTDVILARFYKACPYVLPRYSPQKPNERRSEYLKSIGYEVIANNQLESEETYCKRMEGIVAVYAAILQTPVQANTPHPHGLENGWAWLARIMNLPPNDCTATVLRVFLEVCCYFYRCYIF